MIYIMFNDYMLILDIIDDNQGPFYQYKRLLISETAEIASNVKL